MLPKQTLRGVRDAALRAQQNRFRRFFAAQTGGADLDTLLATEIPQALKNAPNLRRGEPALVWLRRIISGAIAESPRKGATDAAWTSALADCVRAVLPALEPRYAEALRRVDLARESKRKVAREMALTAETMDVLLHRARKALRSRLACFCVSCSRRRSRQ